MIYTCIWEKKEEKTNDKINRRDKEVNKIGDLSFLKRTYSNIFEK